MSTPRKLATYAAVLAAVFGASTVAGRAIDPTGLANAEPVEEHGGMPAEPPADVTVEVPPDTTLHPAGHTAPVGDGCTTDTSDTADTADTADTTEETR